MLLKVNIITPPVGHAGYTGISPTDFLVRPSRQRERLVQSGIGANRTARKRQWPYPGISRVTHGGRKFNNVNFKKHHLHGGIVF